MNDVQDVNPFHLCLHRVAPLDIKFTAQAMMPLTVYEPNGLGYRPVCACVYLCKLSYQAL